MTIRRRVIVLACAAAFYSTLTSAETITLTCKFEGSDQANTQREIQDVNQLFIDSEVPMVELRVAQTMGTNNPMYFGFTNRTARGATDDQIRMIFLGAKVSVAAIRLGIPSSIVLNRISGMLVWSGVDDQGARSYRYHCK